jgi:hypothetical protein
VVQHEERHTRNLSIHRNANTNDEPRKSGSQKRGEKKNPDTNYKTSKLLSKKEMEERKIAILTDADSTQLNAGRERERERERALPRSFFFSYLFPHPSETNREGL